MPPAPGTPGEGSAVPAGPGVAPGTSGTLHIWGPIYREGVHIWGGGVTAGDRGDVSTCCPLVASAGECTLPLPDMGKLRHKPNPSPRPGGHCQRSPPLFVPSVLLVPPHVPSQTSPPHQRGVTASSLQPGCRVLESLHGGTSLAPKPAMKMERESQQGCDTLWGGEGSRLGPSHSLRCPWGHSDLSPAQP